ncbi:Retrovirus-related Pol polyprotein from transposon 17.6 [Gossypium australe]|uniref:Retrovirus-related Pol polyprotein from transposon 17.6 n=1 Tax=Gossypium australe TaxID=47621 RepID=A0A5B6UXU2_9ROSI|nr:Retrovirus-related Pol polyprotein from transposon 17.6 [Gossypium australe]
MCDTSDYAIGAVLGQVRNKIFHPIYYASQNLTGAQLNYTVTEKELLVDFAFSKFHLYLLDEKLTLIRWVLLLQEFDMEKGREPSGRSSIHIGTRKHSFIEHFPDKHIFELFKQCVDQKIKRFVAKNEVADILDHCHSYPSGGHFEGSRTVAKVLQVSFFWPTLFKDAYAYVKDCS